ncbi:putative cytoplasmic tRNA 2-thiolation protein 1 [Kockovaella imperatae]|uniref:Cytoplasmic tRNA 2-thiolation protein 1 n=1 Tax=Kockovaella imperatae TaxID=4999 RepID=A0A1Y1UKM1_9TREE|nr:putative cytoplasmic tRNA 2-thiolation protein 1 [Kockovaella imperatae]ORX38603.1 putative cytoplasmic tRNA 2-thiolation protein 1 [Kockovaella imperatae]
MSGLIKLSLAGRIMPPTPCSLCETARALVKRPKTGQQVCKECFFTVFETEVHNTIIQGDDGQGIFKRGERVAIGASGGKDSTVLAHVLSLLNQRYDYGLDLFLLSIDEGITGYRDDSLETVKQNQVEYGLPLKILSYDELYGWTMDRIVQQVGKKNNCTFCGVFRRQALDRGAAQLDIDHIVTGHNADDIAETVLMNIMRGDIARLGRCTAVTTRSEDTMRRSKPFKYAYEKEIVMYAYFKKLTYFSTECIYSPDAYRGHARVFLKDLEAIRPSAIIDIIHSGETFKLEQAVVKGMKPLQSCARCGYMSSNTICKACALLQGLEAGLDRSALKQSQDETSVLPDGQRMIPKYERLRRDVSKSASQIDGLEKPLKGMAIS